MKALDRRKFIKLGSTGSAVLLSWPFLNACEGLSSKKNESADPDFEPDLDIDLTAKESQIPLFQGSSTKVWMFETKINTGADDAIQQLNDIYLGPILRVRKGQKVRIRFKNKLPEKSIVHWHGMHVPEKYDGHPKDVIENGETYIYEFEIMNRAGTYWFHPHPHGRTGPQVYNGLAGMLIVSDDEEEKLNLPKGEFDMPIVIQDRAFDQENQLLYLNRGRMDKMMGFMGNRIFINGKPDKNLNLKAGATYRLRFLNASNSRFYKLGWSDGTPLTVIGIDGSLLEKPRSLPYMMLGVAERVDIWLDLKDMPKETELTMKSLPFSTGMMNMGMMGNMGTTLPLGSEYDVLKITLDTLENNNIELPEKLLTLNKIDPSEAINEDNPRIFKFFMRRMQWMINGRTWEETGVADEETVKLNTTEIWQLLNSGGGMMGDGGMMGGKGMMGNGGMMKGGMMQMPHPIHIHQVQFNILERDVSDMDPDVWNSVKEGFIDDGWQDTVLLMPGMKIKIIMRFEDFKGLFLYHCHNLEHEDMGMMRNYKIE
ncbi:MULTISPECIES: multicopper oxidase family protein [Christiangramia]|uniref:Multicopper oxidase n=1 Tax=Christiangramia flava JLT2011 TaxID=1229726 RepID=A0A1L7I997_9FLAO|nr:multicopper oxidase family protein [Christiangramia flava]APU70178.1 Multicopper oxidase [Christiangramia flava JLT2011]OSS39665.1 Multicopper oxidase [Christiangramia flava JLT2011]